MVARRFGGRVGVLGGGCRWSADLPDREADRPWREGGRAGPAESGYGRPLLPGSSGPLRGRTGGSASGARPFHEHCESSIGGMVALFSMCQVSFGRSEGVAPRVSGSASVVVSQAIVVGLCGARGAVGVAGWSGRLGCRRHAAAVWPGGRGAGCARPPGTRRTAVAASAGDSPNSAPPGEAARLSDVLRRFRAQACVNPVASAKGQVGFVV